MKTPILIVDDDPDVISALQYLLQTEDYQVTTAAHPEAALEAIKSRDFVVALIDLNYSEDTTSGKEGIRLIDTITSLDAQLAIVAMTAWGSIEMAVKAMQAGAHDFIQKPWENERLLSTVANQVRLARSERKAQRLSEENKLLRSELEPDQKSPIFASPLMQKTMAQLEQVAASDVNLLLTGENGTGKSFLVQHVHTHSSRREGPLIKVNMGAITETLFESEMFGHEKGAFTDARETRLGRFELTEGGTLFLDEIGNTPYSQQAKLLRVLEDRSFERVGGHRTLSADCRLVSATNSDLELAVQEGRFRQDLLYRINTMVIEVPPLRRRQEDIPVLADYFLAQCRHKYGKSELEFSRQASEALQAYQWPGNVRELAHIVERASILSRKLIEPTDLGLDAHSAYTADNSDADWSTMTLEAIEKQVIESRLESYGGKGPQAAESLGLSKSAFYRHLKKFDLK